VRLKQHTKPPPALRARAAAVGRRMDMATSGHLDYRPCGTRSIIGFFRTADERKNAHKRRPDSRELIAHPDSTTILLVLALKVAAMHRQRRVRALCPTPTPALSGVEHRTACRGRAPAWYAGEHHAAAWCAARADLGLCRCPRWHTHAHTRRTAFMDALPRLPHFASSTAYLIILGCATSTAPRAGAFATVPTTSKRDYR